MERSVAKVVEKIRRTPGAISVRMERSAAFSYQAGQWAEWMLPGGLVRTLTISSSPTESFLEFTKRLSSSDFSSALGVLAPGDLVGVRGPGGTFGFPSRSEGPEPVEGPVKAAFLTGGIGITPFRSILRFQADTGRHPDRIFLFFNRNIDEIPFGPELEEIARRDPTFELVHVLEEPPPGWAGWTGRIRREILEKEIPDLARRLVFVCGPPPMIAAADALLAEMGVPPARVRKELFAQGTSPTP
jgi:ferredoxin-NADP reductase